MFRKIKIIAVCLIVLLMLLIGIITFSKNNEINVTTNNIKIYEMTEEEIQNLETKEIEEKTIEEEKQLEVERFEEQGNIEYNGSQEKPEVTLGSYIGLTYYSQVDTRWKDKLYTSIGDKSQTMGSSGCGPTAAAMIVTATRGTITPPDMGDLFVKYGYRSENSGTYWAAFPWIADVFNIEYEETSSLDEAIEKIKEGNLAVVSCSNGLFTYGGHFVVIVGIDGNTLKIYDPYLYSGKFNTSTRKGKVSVNGNTVYCSIENFRNYAKYRNFFLYKSDGVNISETSDLNKNDEIANNVNSTKSYNAKVTAKIGLRIRNGAGTNYARIGAYSYGENITILEEKNGWGRTQKGWISLDYTNKIDNGKDVSINNSSYSTGTYKVNCSKLNVRTGPGTNYKIKSISELTKSARKQGGYVRNVVCTVYEVRNNWGRTPSGWVCLDYCVKIR